MTVPAVPTRPRSNEQRPNGGAAGKAAGGRARPRPEGLAALGIAPGRLFGGALLAGVAPGVAALLAQGQPWWPAVVAGAGALPVLLAVHRLLAHAREAWLLPLQHALGVVEDMRRGVPNPRMRESGAPLLNALAESLNAACTTIDRRTQLSHANLMSAEVAFDRIHSVLQSLTEGVVLIDVKGRVVLANRAARRVTLDDGKPIEGRELAPLLDEALGDHVRQGLAALEAGEHDLAQVMGVEVGDRVYDVNVVRVQSSRPGHDFGFVVAFADVTRNSEIARLKDEFISSISHELRTPLTNICAFTEILGSLTPDNEGDWREFLAIVATESQRLRTLVDDILEHGRLQRGLVEWSLEPVDLGALVRAVLGLVEARAAQQGVKLECTTAGEDLVARVDRERLHQVLARLLDNALKFTPRGGTVRVAAAALDGAVEVAVEDSGKGIPAEHRETVFERFKQIGDHLTDKPAGAGLGLPICRAIVDGMGGTMWCEESELGGARLRFVLPRARQDEAADPGAEEAGPLAESDEAPAEPAPAE